MYCYLLVLFSPIKGFPGGSDSKESACNARDLGLIPGSGRSPGGESTLVFLPGKFHGQRNPGGYSPWGHNESDMTEQLSTCWLIVFQTVDLSRCCIRCDVLAAGWDAWCLAWRISILVGRIRHACGKRGSVLSCFIKETCIYPVPKLLIFKEFK